MIACWSHTPTSTMRQRCASVNCLPASLCRTQTVLHAMNTSTLCCMCRFSLHLASQAAKCNARPRPDKDKALACRSRRRRSAQTAGTICCTTRCAGGPPRPLPHLSPAPRRPPDAPPAAALCDIRSEELEQEAQEADGCGCETGRLNCVATHVSLGLHNTRTGIVCAGQLDIVPHK
jgi:hypothetical protein